MTRAGLLVGASILVVAVVAVASARDAAAQETPIDKKTCIAAAERGQELRDAKHMRDARAQFALCARSECPKSVASECSRWRAEADAALGSIKLEAVDEQGKPVTGVKVLVDGSPATDDLSVPLMLDPGSHEIRFERQGAGAGAGAAPVVRTITLAMGERDQVVRATFASTSSSGTAPAGSPKPGSTKEQDNNVTPAKSSGSGGSLVLPIAIGSVGVVSLGLAGTFWLLGNSDLDDAKTRCSAGCADPSSETSDAKTKHLIGDIALGVGVVAIVAAAYLLITREKAPATTIAIGRF